MVDVPKHEGLKLLGTFSKLLQEPSLTDLVGAAFLEIGTKTRHREVRRALFNLVFSAGSQPVTKFLDDISTLRTTVVRYSPIEKKPALVVVRSHQPFASSILQLLFHSRSFQAAVFSSECEVSDFVMNLRTVFAHMWQGLRSPLDVADFPHDLDVYVKQFPNTISVVQTDENVDQATFRTPLVLVVLNDWTGDESFVDCPKYKLIGMVAESTANGKIGAILFGSKHTTFYISEGICTAGPFREHIAEFLAEKNVKPLVLFYQVAHVVLPAWSISSRILPEIQCENDVIRKMDCYFSDDLFKDVLRCANKHQWLGYFFNIICRGRFEGRSQEIDQKNSELVLEPGDLSPFLHIIPSLWHSDVKIEVRDSISQLLAHAIRTFPLPDCFPVIDAVLEPSDSFSVWVIEQFCGRGEQAIQYLRQRDVGKKLIDLLGEKSFVGDPTSVFRVLMYFPVPELSKVAQIDAGESIVNPDEGDAFIDLLIYSCIHGAVPREDIPDRDFSARVNHVIAFMLKRGELAAVVHFAQQHNLLRELAGEMKENIDGLAEKLVGQPALLQVLLTRPQVAEVATSILTGLRDRTTADAFGQLVQELKRGTSEHPNDGALVLALQSLEG
jgi:hypothetical protein